MKHLYSNSAAIFDLRSVCSPASLSVLLRHGERTVTRSVSALESKLSSAVTTCNLQLRLRLRRTKLLASPPSFNLMPRIALLSKHWRALKTRFPLGLEREIYISYWSSMATIWGNEVIPCLAKQQSFIFRKLMPSSYTTCGLFPWDILKQFLGLKPKNLFWGQSWLLHAST